MYNNLPVEIKTPQVTTRVVFVGAFESEFGFTLKERKSHSLDQIQTVVLEVEAHFTSTMKSKGRYDHGEKKKGKEEATSSIQGREFQEQRIEEMGKLIKNLSNKLTKMDMKNKILQ